ncbi:MAG TPA: hypothetical protein VMS94_06110 [Acidobacteriota bacterium]|jgi:tellurite resistance protein TehA-like permease|nr:hypothetical protein [Acidobacteriota bacterium]
MDRRTLPLIVSVSYIVLLCAALIIVGSQLNAIHSIQEEVNDAIRSINTTVSYLWIIGIAVLIITLVLYFSTTSTTEKAKTTTTKEP